MTRITYEGAADTSLSCTLIQDDTHSYKPKAHTHTPYTHVRTVYRGQWRVKEEEDTSHLHIHKQAGAHIGKVSLLVVFVRFQSFCKLFRLSKGCPTDQGVRYLCALIHIMSFEYFRNTVF